MASVSVSHLVIFIASLVLAASVAGALVTGVDRISDGISDRSLDTSEEIRTDVSIISDPGSDAIYEEDEGGTVTLLVKNTGSSTLEATSNQVDVLTDGEYVPDANVTVTSVEGDSYDWTESAVVRVDANRTLEDGDHRVLIRVNGDEEVLEFRV